MRNGYKCLEMVKNLVIPVNRCVKVKDIEMHKKVTNYVQSQIEEGKRCKNAVSMKNKSTGA